MLVGIKPPRARQNGRGVGGNKTALWRTKCTGVALVKTVLLRENRHGPDKILVGDLVRTKRHGAEKKPPMFIGAEYIVQSCLRRKPKEKIQNGNGDEAPRGEFVFENGTGAEKNGTLLSVGNPPLAEENGRGVGWEITAPRREKAHKVAGGNGSGAEKILQSCLGGKPSSAEQNGREIGPVKTALGRKKSMQIRLGDEPPGGGQYGRRVPGGKAVQGNKRLNNIVWVVNVLGPNKMGGMLLWWKWHSAEKIVQMVWGKPPRAEQNGSKVCGVKTAPERKKSIQIRLGDEPPGGGQYGKGVPGEKAVQGNKKLYNIVWVVNLLGPDKMGGVLLWWKWHRPEKIVQSSLGVKPPKKEQN
ncbi:hypothetical protein T10_8883 [Trichinella papuae]|uniref:Uncharacterized protein n=1 Tax=Trichinella papuae TaxID=268474 RepID=A0A0V1M5M6_9BILA|nr:hypothetical protein T10_8883 [Trichinella papuae]